jgi:hypothetical protein
VRRSLYDANGRSIFLAGFRGACEGFDMSEKQVSGGSSGIGLCGALFLVLFVLKVIGKISCSWFWVTLPLWGGLAFILAFLLFCFTMALATGQLGGKK